MAGRFSTYSSKKTGTWRRCRLKPANGGQPGATLRLVVFAACWREALAGVEGFIEADPLHVIEGDGGGAVGPVADGKVKVAVAEDFVLAHQVTHAGATVLVRFEAA